MKVGDKVSRCPETFGRERPLWGKSDRITLAGCVVYIHPKGRFHVVAFPMPRGIELRESFIGTGVEPLHE